jgi:RHS repeat-associated protein
VVKSTYHVLNDDGDVVPVEEFAVARGDSLDEVYGSQLASIGFVGGTADSSGILRANLDSNALPTSLNEQQTGDMPTDYGFAGHRHDNSTGLIYMGARYYDPYLGRFISPDTSCNDATIRKAITDMPMRETTHCGM